MNPNDPSTGAVVAPAPRRLFRLPEALQARDFRRFWVGETVSLFGDQATQIALPLVGVLALRSEERPFTAADERVLTNIAGLAALDPLLEQPLRLLSIQGALRALGAYPCFLAFTAAVSAGTIFSASPTTPRSAIFMIGASASLLMAMMIFEVFMPTVCCIAPEIPTAMYTPGRTDLPVCPTCIE